MDFFFCSAKVSLLLFFFSGEEFHLAKCMFLKAGMAGLFFQVNFILLNACSQKAGSFSLAIYR